MKRLLAALLALSLGVAFAVHDSAAHASPLQDHDCAVCSVQASALAPDAPPSVAAAPALVSDVRPAARPAAVARASRSAAARAPPR